MGLKGRGFLKKKKDHQAKTNLGLITFKFWSDI